MKTKISLMTLIEHGIPLTIAFVAVVMLILTPFWAFQWFHQPFLGALIEPHNVVSLINGTDWPARNQGVQWSDRLMAINGQTVTDVRSMNRLLTLNGFQPLTATFLRQDGSSFTLQITPIHVHWSDLVSLFVIPYLVGLIFLGTGAWAYRIRPDLRASRAFLTFTAATSMVTVTFLDMNTTHYVVLLWSLSLPISAGALTHLSLVFPQPMPFVDRRPLSRYFPWLITLVAAVPITRDILFPRDVYAYILSWRWGGYLYIAAAMFFFLATLTVRILRSHLPMIRQQSRVIIFGALIAFLPMLLLYLLPSTFGGQVPEFRSALYFPPLIFLPLSVTYAIVRYRLLDVDRILSRVLTYLITTAVVLGIFYALAAGLSFVVQRTVQPNDPMLIATYLLVLVLGLTPLRTLIQRAIDRVFYRSPADYRRVLTYLSKNLAITPDLGRTLTLLEKEIRQSLAPEKFVVYLYHDELGQYLPHASREDSAPTYEATDPLIKMIKTSPAPLWLSPGKPLPPDLPANAQRLAGFTFVPLHYEGSLIGFLMLGQKRSGDLYSGDDLDFLAAVAAQSTLALENARLFTNLRRTYEQTLEMKNLMDDIFASVATGIITTDISRQITLFNRAAETILGLPMAQVLGKPITDALPDLCPDLEEVAAKAVQHGSITLSADLKRSLPARGELYLRLSCSPLRDAYLGTKGATIVFEDLTQQHRLEAEQERIRQTFGRVVAPRVRDRLLADPSNLRLDGAKQSITVLFADLVGFTPFGERTSPETVFKVLNSYLDLAAQAILDEEGTLDKFMGDAVLAFWNAPDPQPDHALRAVRAALSIIQRGQEAHRRFSDSEHRRLFRIGVVSGPAMIGNVGTDQLFNYTAIGDTVNLAQRLQTVAQPSQILISKSLYDLVTAQVTAMPLEPVIVKGREHPVEVYLLQGLK